MGNRNDSFPVRTCISCGAKRPKGELMRLVLDPEGKVVQDESGVRPGRGAYVCRGGLCLERLPQARWERAFRIRNKPR
ncbi:MAG: YlxR family protein [Thermodesulfobacteriota bacterium]